MPIVILVFDLRKVDVIRSKQEAAYIDTPGEAGDNRSVMAAIGFT